MKETNEEILEFEDLSLDESVNEFISSQGASDEFKCYLYQFDEKNRRTTKPAFVDSFESYCPSMREMAEQFGGGKYRINIVFPGKDESGKQITKSFCFYIHDRWKKDNACNVQQNNVNYINPQQLLADSMAMISGAMNQILTPILAVVQQRQQQNPAKESIQYMGLANEMMKQQSLSYLDFCKTASNKLINSEYQEDDQEEQEEQEEGNALLDMLKPILNDWLPKLLSDSTQGTIATQTLKALPAFKQAVKNKQQLGSLISFLDQEKGAEVTNKLLEKLKIKRP
jgi:hypothetical protein